MGRKFALPAFVGLIGMFVCHFFILLAFGRGERFPIYIFTYPVVFPLLALALTIKRHRLWLSNALLVCAVPLVYWYVLLWNDGKINTSSFDLLRPTGLLVVMPLTVAISCLATFSLRHFFEEENTKTTS